MKQAWDGLTDLLKTVADKVAESVPGSLEAPLNVIYFPQMGFLTAIPLDPTTGAAMYDGNYENPWERMFNTEYVTLLYLNLSNNEEGHSIF